MPEEPSPGSDVIVPAVPVVIVLATVIPSVAVVVFIVGVLPVAWLLSCPPCPCPDRCRHLSLSLLLSSKCPLVAAVSTVARCFVVDESLAAVVTLLLRQHSFACCDAIEATSVVTSELDEQ
jgi:hypothetical protein